MCGVCICVSGCCGVCGRCSKAVVVDAVVGVVLPLFDVDVEVVVVAVVVFDFVVAIAGSGVIVSVSVAKAASVSVVAAADVAPFPPVIGLLGVPPVVVFDRKRLVFSNI